MNSIIEQYFSKYVDLTEDVKKAMADNLLIKEFPKGTVLLKQGEFCNECYFILKGFARTYYLKEGDEVTTDFFMEEQAITPPCYGKNIPSDQYIECLEDTFAFIGTPDLEEEMFRKYPQLETLARIMGDKIMASFKEDFDSFKLSSPEERYLNLIEKKPALIQRAPQYQIASYLGIKPESLSRIRKRISNR